jgi:Ribbon-helix-helix protein, copG family
MSRKAQFTLPDDLYEELVAEALVTGRSQAEIVRRALEKALGAGKGRAAVRGVEIAVLIRGLPRMLRRIHPRLGPSFRGRAERP